MAKLTVSVAGVDYDRTRAIFDGTIGVDGCETICCAMSPEEAFHRALRYQEFDITELSLSNTILVAKGACPYVGIPVFPSRLFRHSSVYIRTDRGIDRSQDLRGKLVGVPEYQMTAAVSARAREERRGEAMKHETADQSLQLERVVDHLPAGFDELRVEARTEGFRQVERLATDWEACTARFDRDGEALLAARVNGVLAGIGGLTIEPAVPDALRMRRFYVRPAFRHSGVGRHLVTALLAGARADQVITANAAPASIPFWESIGFTPDARDGHTHILNRQRL